MRKILLLPFLLSIAVTEAQTRKVLLEEFTGAHCGQCPMGSYMVDSMANKYPDVIPVALHAYIPSDSMNFAALSALYNGYSAGAPLGNIDRIFWGGSWSYVAQPYTLWDGQIQTRLQKAAPLSIGITPTWNSSNRQITAKADISILANMATGDYRLNLYVVEDSVTGTGGGYDQSNIYNGQQGNPFYQKGDPIIGYIHRHVAREILPSSWGLTGLLPASPQNGQNYSHTFNYTLPAAFKENRIHLVAFVYNYSSAHKTDEVMNAGETKLIGGSVGIRTNEAGKTLVLYPNPAHGNITLMLGEGTKGIVSIVNILGTELFSEPVEGHSIIDLRAFSAGIYAVRVCTGAQTLTQKLVIRN